MEINFDWPSVQYIIWTKFRFFPDFFLILCYFCVLYITIKFSEVSIVFLNRLNDASHCQFNLSDFFFQHTIHCTDFAQLDRKSDSDLILPSIFFSHPCRGGPQSSFKPEVVSCTEVDVKEGLRHTPWDYIHCQQCHHLVGCHVSLVSSPVQWFGVVGQNGDHFLVLGWHLGLMSAEYRIYLFAW